MATFKITAISKLKHADLWKAAKAVGGQSALAKYLGVHYSQLCDWCNLMKVPSHRWTDEKRANIEKKLFDLTGKTLDELFPPELEAAEKFLKTKKVVEVDRDIELSGLLDYAAQTAERLTYECPTEHLAAKELADDINLVLNTLSYREREIVKLRYGLGDGFCFTLDEVANVFKITRERVRQIEAKAIRKLQQPSRAGKVIQHIGV